MTAAASETPPVGRLAGEHDDVDVGRVADGDRQLAEVVRRQTVDARDDDAVDRPGGELARLGAGEPGAQLLVLVVEGAQLVELAPDATGRRRRGVPTRLAISPRQSLVALEERHRAGAGDGLDASQVGADRPFADDLDRADVAGGADVRAAAELDRTARLEHTHDVAVLLAEEGDRAEALGLVLGCLEGPHRRVRQRLAVRQVLDAGDLLGAERRVVREVEPQAIGGDERAGLLDVLAEHLAQGVVDEMGRRVVAADRVAPFDVDRRVRRLGPG